MQRRPVATSAHQPASSPGHASQEPGQDRAGYTCSTSKRHRGVETSTEVMCTASVATLVLLSVWTSYVPLTSGAGPMPRHAGLGSSLRVPAGEITQGSRVILVDDVMEWSGSLRHGEVGVVQMVDGSRSNRFKRVLVRLPNGKEVWHEQDEVKLTRDQVMQPGMNSKSAPGETAPVDCALGPHYPVSVTASSGSRNAAELAGRRPTASAQDCSRTKFVASWLPEQSAPDLAWLKAHFTERMHIKDLVIYKRGAAGLIRQIEGLEPRYDGHKTRTVFDGVDNTACGNLVVRMPSLTPWSIDRLHFSIAPVEFWLTPESGAEQEQGGIASIEIFGLLDSCYPAFVGESSDDTKQRKRMEEGFTGCSFSGISFSEADRRIGGNPEDLIPGEGDTGGCGDL